MDSQIATNNIRYYELIRLNLKTNTIAFPNGMVNDHIRLLNISTRPLKVIDASNKEILTMSQEVVSFVFLNDTWITYSSY
jgi:hypothetical protein